jgi:hypothetical protein
MVLKARNMTLIGAEVLLQCLVTHLKSQASQQNTQTTLLTNHKDTTKPSFKCGPASRLDAALDYIRRDHMSCKLKTFRVQR